MEKAKIALDTAKLNYEIKKNGTSATELDISQKQVDRDLVSLEGSKKETDSDIEAAKRALEVARKIKTGAEKQAKIDVL